MRVPRRILVYLLSLGLLLAAFDYSDDDDESTDSGTDSEPSEIEDEVAPPSTNISWVTSEKGKQVLVHEGFTYYFKQNTSEGSVYRCSEHQSLCPVKIWLQDGRFSKLEGVHNHFANPIKLEWQRVTNEAKALLRANPLSSIRDIIDNALEGKEEVVISDGDRENLRRLLSRLKTVS